MYPNTLCSTQGFYGESWTIQCKIVDHEMLHLIPADEEMIPPLPANGHPPPFDCFGLGQPGHAPENNFHQNPGNADQEQQ
jgi:hypothetical protein